MKPTSWGIVAIACLAAGVTAWVVSRPAAVPVVAVTESALAQSLVFSGRVAAIVRVELGATVTGRIAEVLVREGDRVQAGQLLARLDADELQAQAEQAQANLELARARAGSQQELALPTSQATLAQASANLAAARQEARRSRDLLARGFVAQARVDETERAVQVAQAQVDAAQAAAKVNRVGGNEVVQARLRVREAQAAAALAQARLQQTRIVAPAAGRIVLRSVDPGQIVQPGRVLFQFAAEGSTQLLAQADEKFLGLLARGQTAQVVVDAFPAQAFAASVASIAPGIDAQRGTVEVKFAVASPPPFLREDMTLSLRVEVGRKERALTLPAGAVLGAGSEGRVRTIADGRIVEQPVRIGLRTLERVEVLSGVARDTLVLAQPLAAEPGTRARAVSGR
ncbi:MAG TPA: efflux RND transporter periplasmic adaptor subunit [Burkholderiaceae bacterium]|jgi:HlyD family secretion protein|nr:efflux RND transporter periplasmic adaptor subunit [Burkholderiaceae bacterium]